MKVLCRNRDCKYNEYTGGEDGDDVCTKDTIEMSERGVCEDCETASRVEYWRNAATCEKPRGSCRACPTTNCYFKDMFKEEQKSLNLVGR